MNFCPNCGTPTVNGACPTCAPLSPQAGKPDKLMMAGMTLQLVGAIITLVVMLAFVVFLVYACG